MFNCGKKEKSPTEIAPPEYKVIEKKHASGDVYYIGESEVGGERAMLAKCPYAARRTAPSYSGLGHLYDACSAAQWHKDNPVKYVLVSIAQAARYGGYSSGITYSFAKFKDPVEVRDIICKIRKDALTEKENLSYRKVVSVGECKCL